MEEIIKNMIERAEISHDYELAEFAYRIMNELARTWNCPSNWRNIGEQMAAQFQGNDWAEENCKLWEF